VNTNVQPDDARAIARLDRSSPISAGGLHSEKASRPAARLGIYNAAGRPVPMSKALQLLLISAFVLHAWRAAAQPLTMEDYDRFYDTVIRNASNQTREAWLASYDPIVNFVARVRRDVEALPVERQRALARAVHDNGYWKGQEARVRDPRDPFLGAALSGDEARLKAVVTPEGHEAYRTRYAQGARGYRPAIAPPSTGCTARTCRACPSFPQRPPSSTRTRGPGTIWWPTRGTIRSRRND
jgi:hypothetical protein